MLSLNNTMDGIIKRLRFNRKAHRDISEISRTPSRLILSASCIEMGRESLGRIIVKEIKSLPYHNKPSRIGFELDGSKYGTFCDPSEVLIVCHWVVKAA